MKSSLLLLCAGCLAVLPGSASEPRPAEAAAVSDALPAGTFVSPSLAETLRMIRAGVDDTVLLAYVQSSAGTLNLGADQVVFLRDLGTSPELLDAMFKHDRELALRAVRISPVPQPAATAANWRDLTAASLPGKLAEWQPGTAYAELASQLAPYGRWFELPGYGWCWQPWIATLRPGWRPYGQGGRWLLSDHGWYWESDFSWGNLVFHYGRWFHDSEAGWCWWPDTRWAPAWVTWRTGPEVVAWAPLPPGSELAADGQRLAFLGEPTAWNSDFQLSWEDYVYLTWPLFYSSEPGRDRLRGDDTADAYLASAPWNDFFADAKSTAVNRGVSLATVTRASGMVLQTVPVREVPLAAGRSIEPDQVVTENGQVSILHPCAAPRSVAAVPPPVPAPAASPGVPIQARPVFATPWRGPTGPAAEPAPPSGFERFAEELLDHPTYETAPEQPKSTWPMRPSQPVKFTDPILAPRPYSAATANIQIIRMFPR
jgi:hypothetical protein